MLELEVNIHIGINFFILLDLQKELIVA